MRIEVLFPELGNLYGDTFNARYLAKCLPEAELIFTGLEDAPAFAAGDVDMVCMHSMTERAQALAAGALAPYKEKLLARIDEGTIFLITGNAFEIFGQYIQEEDGSRIPCLGLFDTHAERQMLRRYNALYLGEFDGMEIVGFKNQFSHSYGDNSDKFLFKTKRGVGLNPQTGREGIRINNFFATYLLGPFLVLNPLFTKYLIGLLGAEERPLAFEPVMMETYKQRLSEFSNPKVKF